VTIELTDFNTKKVVDTLEVDACLVATGRAPYTNGLSLNAIGVETDRRGFVPVGWGGACAGGEGRRGMPARRRGAQAAAGRRSTALPARRTQHAAPARSHQTPPAPALFAPLHPQTSEKMEVLDKNGKVVPNVYCIGDANGKYMLAHAASAQVRGLGWRAGGGRGGGCSQGGGRRWGFCDRGQRPPTPVGLGRLAAPQAAGLC
jgi:hypothetical protein